MMLKWLTKELFGGGESPVERSNQPILPTPDGRPVPVSAPVEPEADALQPVKTWSHPFKSAQNPLLQLTHLAKAAAGFYPLGISGLWHGGVHFDGGTAGTVDQSSVHCLADGEVVAYRIDRQTPTTAFWVEKLLVNKPFSRNFVLVRHQLQPPKIEGSPDPPPSLTFYSLYMHLQDWAVYQEDAKVARPGFWPEGTTRQVKESASDVRPGQLDQRGLNVRNQANKGAVIGFLPRGAQVSVSGDGDGEFRRLENTQGPEALQNPDGSLKGYIAASFLQPIADGQYRVVTQKGPLTVRAEAHRQSPSIGHLPRGTEVTVSGDGEYRKLGHIKQYVHFASLQGAREPVQDCVVVLDQPVPIKAGDLIGHIGWYQDSAVEHPEQRLHLEVFSTDVVDNFIQASRAWDQRLPPTSKTWLKLAKGTAVVAHQDRFNAKQAPTLKAPNTPSAADVLLPKSLLDGLPAGKKIKVPTKDGSGACTWYRVDGLLHDAENNLLDGWVCEDNATPWVSPWSWENHEVLYNWDGPRTLLASFRRATGQMNDAELQRFGATADLGDTGPLKTRLHDLIDRNGDGIITAKELQAAISLPAYAQSLSQLIIHAESEWKYTPYKWDGLDELVGHSNSTPLLNWVAEKERVQQICWWDEVAGKVGLPEDGKVYHFHPVGLVGCFSSIIITNSVCGKITFDAEGNDLPGSIHYSRVIHWPGNELSGVTLGRGYDMGGRSRTEIYDHMTRAGIPHEQSTEISLAYGLKGNAAKDFVQNRKEAIGEITPDQQIALFNIIYPSYVSRTINVYDKWTRSEVTRHDWESLDIAIRDVLVDFVYQGFTGGPNPMRSGMRNSREEMIAYIEGTPAISRYEPGRQRANYLRTHK